ncbi:MAG: citrate synthase [Nitrospirota bacterium]|nr:citrate synthase [Nitrospirota bacterium]
MVKNNSSAETKNIGLRGVTVADTKICGIHGEEGVLIYRGFNINVLVRSSTYEETSFLLLNGRLPDKQEFEQFKAALSRYRQVPDGIIQSLRIKPRTAHPMDVLQSCISMLAGYDTKVRDESRPANVEKALRLISATPTLVAAWERIRNGQEPVAPDNSLGHAANFLYMLTGNAPHPDTAKDLDICLILHADHSFNASTFTARSVASTRAHMYAAVTAAIGALMGELHGGANEQVMRMLEEIGAAEKVDDWVKARLAAGDKIMGMGHAVYRTNDPRALVLEQLSERLGYRTGETKWHRMSRRIEETTREEFYRMKGKEIYPNVDMYSASVYHQMGIATDLFTPVFAVSRMVGWCAHVIEEKFAEAQPKPAIYRPAADYTGHYCGNEGCDYLPLDDRS